MDGFLCRWLRPHQREGVQFLFDCCMGLRDFDGAGCILADDMGLGKTLQSIAILWTLMRQGFDGSPAVRHAIVVCPVSLVTNWESEICKKWIKEERLRAAGIDVIAVAEASKDEVRKMVRRFTLSRSAILILSYETFRLHQRLFDKGNQCGLLICDEAHRLKNKETQTAVALTALATRRRILLSGTPIQNDLHEFYSMVHFANPGLLGSERDFHREYQSPILRGREPDATEKDVACGAAKSSQLGLIVNQFILRRTNQLLSKHLPPKIVSVVCCSMTSLQLAMYRQFLNSKVARQALNGGKQSMVLESINSLRKLVNHPMLVVSNGQAAKGFEDCIDMLPAEETGDASLSRRGNRPGRTPFRAEYSGKMSVLVQLLRHVRATTNDRVVLVSNYTQTLDLFERMCAAEGWASCKLDGSCSIKKRTKMVDDINDRHSSLFAFLLSSKAGGCGLNLVGANRLVLFDPDWNPANDKQAAARVWRDGQKKRVYIYRMLAAACIEEKVFERQLSKEGLSGIATNEEVEASSFSSKDLRDLFTLHEGCDSHLYERIKSLVPDEAAVDAAQEADPAPTDFVPGGADPIHRQVGCPKESGDMHLWAHHASAASVDDESLRAAALAAPKEEGGVSFVFSLHVKGMDLEAARKADEAAAAAEAASATEAAEEAAKAKAARGTTEDKENRMLATARATASAMAALQALKGGRSGKTEPLQAHGRSAASSAAAAKRGAGAKTPAAKCRRKGYGSSEESEASDESSAESEEEEESEASEEEASMAESEESEPEEEEEMQSHDVEGEAVDEMAVEPSDAKVSAYVAVEPSDAKVRADMAVEPSDAKVSAELTKGRACGPGMARRRPRSAVILSMSEEEQVALAIRSSLTEVSPPPADVPAPRPATQASMPPAARTMPAEVPDARDPAAGDSAGSSLSSVISLNETGWTAPPASSGSKIRRLSLGNKVRMTQA